VTTAAVQMSRPPAQRAPISQMSCAIGILNLGGFPSLMVTVAAAAAAAGHMLACQQTAEQGSRF